MNTNELLVSGHTACAGCGAMIMMRHILKELGERTIMVLPACCSTLLMGVNFHSSLKIPLIHCPFETAAAMATGVRAALDLEGDTETTVLAWAGDGGTFDIGLQALSGAVERNENFIYVCYDNEAYMNTGIQRSSATPWAAWTTTTPRPLGKTEPKKDIVKILAAHKIPYVATATLAFMDDLTAKVRKAKRIKGARFIHLLSPCQPGWRTESKDTVKLSRLAVQTGIFPLYGVENGEIWRITYKPDSFVPVKEYLKLQGRFSHLTDEDIETIQKNVDKEWLKLLKLEAK
jgi:pyruvate/2-oxoacid:ferredoxin oxidoreductase beta subunit